MARASSNTYIEVKSTKRAEGMAALGWHWHVLVDYLNVNVQFQAEK